jgi:sulfatase modifying factor 1
MVRVEHGAGSFYIDSTEVTNAAYAKWIHQSTPAKPSDVKDPRCAWNTSFEPSVQDSPCTAGMDPDCKESFEDRAAQSPNHPVHCVDWCDALAYCELNGKHLCGGAAGAPIVMTEEPGEFVADNSQWYNACSGGKGLKYPYGPTLDPNACNDGFGGGGAIVDVGEASCQGGFPGIFDMSGNVDEWVDACFGSDGTDVNCVRGGGAYYSDGGPGRVLPDCDEYSTFEIRCQNNSTGFRCCAE